MSARVLIAERIAQSGIDQLETTCDVTAVPGWGRDELLQRIGEFDGIVVRSATKVDAELLERATRLRVVGRAGVGVDNVDLELASRRGIVVVNAPTSTVQSVAEHTMGLLFALARNIPQGDAALKAGDWARSRLGGVELAGRTLALLGVGRIGQVVGEMARSLGLRVVGFDPFVSPERFAALGIERCATMEEALGRGEIVSLHLPLTPGSRGLLNAERLAMLPAGARIVNAARGALIDLDALDAALESGHVAGAALDVFPVEPPPPHPVFAHPNVVLTPHLAASTAEAQDRAGIAVAEQVAAALGGGVVTTAVNIPNIAPEDVEALQPFVPLARRLGSMAHALAGPPVSRIRVESEGSIGDRNVRMLTLAALGGLLEGSSDDPVTMVNALSIAEARGIEFDERTDPGAQIYHDLVSVTAVGSTGSATVRGTTIGATDRARLVEALGFRIEIELADHMAFFHYGDVPGVIGLVGTAFGSAGVNIANMAVARREGKALMAISFDEAPPPGVVSELTSEHGFDWGLQLHPPA